MSKTVILLLNVTQPPLHKKNLSKVKPIFSTCNFHSFPLLYPLFIITLFNSVLGWQIDLLEKVGISQGSQLFLTIKFKVISGFCPAKKKAILQVIVQVQTSLAPKGRHQRYSKIPGAQDLEKIISI